MPRKNRKEYQRFMKIKLVIYKGGECQKCGYDDNVKALELHHRDEASKEFALGRNLDNSWVKLKAEADKCDLLCAICHRVTHKPQYSMWKQTCKELINKAKQELEQTED